MDSIHTARKTLFTLLVTTLVLLPAYAQAQDAIGRIILTSSIVNGVNAAGDERSLARGSNVYMGETNHHRCARQRATTPDRRRHDHSE